jgi:hypothetical protein
MEVTMSRRLLTALGLTAGLALLGQAASAEPPYRIAGLASN